MKIISRAIALLIGISLFAMFWGGFIVAEGDAYSPGHHGYVHNPIGIICYGLALVLSFPGMALILRLWNVR